MSFLRALAAVTMAFAVDSASAAATTPARPGSPAALPRGAHSAGLHGDLHRAAHAHPPAARAPAAPVAVRVVPVFVPVVRAVRNPVYPYPVAPARYFVQVPAPSNAYGGAQSAGGTIAFSPSEPPRQSWGWSRVDSVIELVRRSTRDYCPDYEKFYPEVEICPSPWVRSEL